MPGYMPNQSTICKTKGEAMYLAAADKRQILEDTYDVDNECNSYTAWGNIRRDWSIDLSPKDGYSGPDYVITVQPVEEGDIDADDMEKLDDGECITW